MKTLAIVFSFFAFFAFTTACSTVDENPQPVRPVPSNVHTPSDGIDNPCDDNLNSDVRCPD